MVIVNDINKDASKPNRNPDIQPPPSALDVWIHFVQFVKLTPCSGTLVLVKLEDHKALLLEKTDDLTKGGHNELELGVHCNAAGCVTLQVPPGHGF